MVKSEGFLGTHRPPMGQHASQFPKNQFLWTRRSIRVTWANMSAARVMTSRLFMSISLRAVICFSSHKAISQPSHSLCKAQGRVIGCTYHRIDGQEIQDKKIQ